MIDQDFDRLYKEKLEELNEVPETISWNTSIGWNNLINKQHRKLQIPTWLKYVAVLLPLVLIVGLYRYSQSTTELEVADSHGEPSSKIDFGKYGYAILRNHTVLRYPKQFRRGMNQFELDGEAYIYLSAKGGNKSILIQSGNTIIETKSAGFNLKTSDSGQSFELTVEEGSVSISSITNHYGTLICSSGERVTALNNNMLLVKEAYSGTNAYKLKTGIIEYKDIPLFYILKEISDLYEVAMQIEDGDLESKRISLTIKTNDLEQIIRTIQTQAKAQVQYIDGTYHFVKSSNTNL